MKIVESNVHEWKVGEKGSFLTPEGFVLGDDAKLDLCNYSGVPATLVNVDIKHGTHTTLDVLQADNAKAMFAVDDNNQVLSVLDPKSKFMSDEKFEEVVTIFSECGLTPKKEKKTKTLTRRVYFEVPELTTDTFEGDIFKRNLVFERCSQGGVYVGIGLLRLACTNGMLVSEKQFKKVIRSAEMDKDLCKFFAQETEKFHVQKYFHELFFDKNGNPYQASVANFLGMRDTLAKCVGSDLASEFFPLEPISEHYEAQGISISGSPRAILDHIPSGLEYYKCFNILTNGVKRAEDLALADEIAVGSWASANKMRFVKANNVHYQGMPNFNETYVRHLMGDTK